MNKFRGAPTLTPTLVLYAGPEACTLRTRAAGQAGRQPPSLPVPSGEGLLHYSLILFSLPDQGLPEQGARRPTKVWGWGAVSAACPFLQWPPRLSLHRGEGQPSPNPQAPSGGLAKGRG